MGTHLVSCHLGMCYVFLHVITVKEEHISVYYKSLMSGTVLDEVLQNMVQYAPSSNVYVDCVMTLHTRHTFLCLKEIDFWKKVFRDNIRC